MNLLLAELQARYALETFGQDLKAAHDGVTVKRRTRRPIALRERLNRTATWVRLAGRGSAA